ncbi:2'-5' RNA ligase family protein [Nocardioides mesophilus]|uniref:Uncharacterized protein n=1 Tax=Nocardioides mesophilus TaxID=433659 RepID=A0A7G9RBA0_9ACTN|nr:hypothetical protein [Nocardioides mesophilus]QNN52875.1 hypothetical protein H9L09_21030 [Nocardioides mesophilus]
MRLYAAIVPPEDIRAEVASVVDAVAPNTAELDRVVAEDLLIPVTHFGNVTQRDFAQMLQLLNADAESWSQPELRFSGSAALEFEGDRSVWVRADGDLDGLFTIGRGVPVSVKRLGFLVDRRRFRPWLSVGTITDATTAPYLERLTAALDDYKSRSWTLQSLTIVRRVPGESPSQVVDEVIEEVPLGGR